MIVVVVVDLVDFGLDAQHWVAGAYILVVSTGTFERLYHPSRERESLNTTRTCPRWRDVCTRRNIADVSEEADSDGVVGGGWKHEASRVVRCGANKEDEVTLPHTVD